MGTTTYRNRANMNLMNQIQLGRPMLFQSFAKNHYALESGIRLDQMDHHT